MWAVERELQFRLGAFEDVEEVELDVEPAGADAEFESVARERLQGQHELREFDRMPIGGNEDVRGDG